MSGAGAFSAAKRAAYSARANATPTSVAGAAYVAVVVVCLFLELVAPHIGARNAPLSHADGPSPGQCLARGLMDKQYFTASVMHVRDDYDCGCRTPDVYEKHENPRVSAIVQSFNHEGNIPAIAKALVENPDIEEIIICEDGSTDSSLSVWVEHLKDVRHFVVVSNNLHEVRCYNRAMRMSSAEFFVLMQDDDLPGALAVVDVFATGGVMQDGRDVRGMKAEGSQPRRNWVRDALDLMDSDPSLGVVSGFIGQLWDENGKGYEFGEQQSDHGGLRKGPTRRIPFLSRHTHRPFMYVECGWIAPLMVRSRVLRRVGGLDVDVFGVGEPGMWQDCLFSYAAWTAGWRVGVYDAMFERGVGGHGSTSSPEKAKMRDTMWRKAKAVVDGRFERGFIRDHVLKLNNATLDWRYEIV